MIQGWLEKPTDPTGFLRAYGDDMDWAVVPKDGVVVLDIEMKGGLNGLSDLATFGPLPDGPRTKTKSGGFHLWFRSPGLIGGHHIRPGIEAKAGNGSVHIPPSQGYTEIIPLKPPGELPELPPALVDAWRASAKVKSSRDGQYRAETYPVGERRARLCSMAGRLRSCGLTEPELYAALLAVRDNRCDGTDAPTDTDLLRIAKDYAQKPERLDPDTGWFPAK
jgi:hypothetical protein